MAASYPPQRRSPARRRARLRELGRSAWKWIFRTAMLCGIATTALTLLLVLRQR